MAKRYSKNHMEEWPLGKLKDEYVWPVFSRFTRLRDCLETTGTLTKGACVTCGRVYLINKLQAGHFVPGRTDMILFDEVGVHAQCYRCNCKLQGMWHKYYVYMLEKYGQEVIDDIIKRADDKTKYTHEQLMALHAYFVMQANVLEGKV